MARPRLFSDRKPRILSGALLCVLLLSGCTHLKTSKAQYAGMEEHLRQADYPIAIAQIEKVKDKAYGYKDRVVYYLDVGMLYHWNGDYQKSNEMLELAERGIEDNFTKSVTRSASAMLMNDNIQAYAGEDYEDVYLNAFKALNYLALGKNDEAFVELRRINNKLLQLESKHAKTAAKLNKAEEVGETFKPGKSHFVDSALGRYLSLLLYRNELKWDDVRIDLEKIDQGWKMQPAIYTFKKPDFSAETERVYPPTARLNIVAFSGVAPDKKASTFYVHTEENVIILGGTQEDYLGKQELSGLSVIPWYGVSAGYHFKFQLPHMKRRPSQVERIEVSVADQTQKLARLESLENAAIETFSIQKPIIYLRSLTRSVLKGIAAEQAKQKMTENMENGGMAFLTRIVTDIAVGATENADLRVSRFFPAEASIAELHLDEGTYDVTVNYYSGGGQLLHSEVHPSVKIESNRLNVVQSAYLN